MEDWQQWQIQADQVAAQLGEEIGALEKDHFSAGTEPTFRGFWPRFRDLKERVRVAPAIKLEDKLELEKRLRNLGSRAYKAQEGAYARSGERKAELLAVISDFRTRAASLTNPRELRSLRRDLDGVRDSFDSGAALVPADRQAVWDAWKEASQDVWQRLTSAWGENEAHLRQFLDGAREQLAAGHGNDARQSVGRFFEALRTHEARQDSINAMKAEADGIRREAESAQEQRVVSRNTVQVSQTVPALDTWRADLERSRTAGARLEAEVADLDRQFKESSSLLEQAMIRGTLVDKKRRLSEHQRTIKTLEQKIEQTEETPLISAG